MENDKDVLLGQCERISSDIDAFIDGRFYEYDGRTLEVVEDGDTTYFKDSNNGETFAYDTDSDSVTIDGETLDVALELDRLDLLDYFGDVYDIHYVTDSDGSLIGVKLLVAFGGPNIWIDTDAGLVRGYWWMDRANYPLSDAAVEAINEAFAGVCEGLRIHYEY